MPIIQMRKLKFRGFKLIKVKEVGNGRSGTKV